MRMCVHIYVCVRLRACMCVRVCVLDGEGSWVFASTAPVVVGTAIDITGSSDCLTAPVSVTIFRNLVDVTPVFAKDV